MRILFVAPNRIGDAVIVSGVLDHLVRTYPQARFTVACGTPAGGVFERLPRLERLILVDKRKRDLHWLLLWRQVVGTRWDLVVDTKGSALAWLVWARRRAVYRSGTLRKYEQYAEALRLRPAPLPTVWTAAEDEAKAARLLPQGRPWIGLGPTANWDGKLWPADRFAQLVAGLSQAPGCALPGAGVVVLGGPGERERAMASPLLAALPDAVDLCGALSIAETAACIARCALYVGNDSGLMHLAAATGTATVGLCGSTLDRAEEMAPAGRQAVWALADAPTMEALRVETALAACEGLLAASPEGQAAPAA